MTSIRAQAEHAIRLRETTPGMPADGPYPATVSEVAAEFITQLDATCARGLITELLNKLPHP